MSRGTKFPVRGDTFPGGTVFSLTTESLSQLSVVEEVVPMMQTYVLQFGEYPYCGHVLNLPQDIRSLATSLPHTAKYMSVIAVKCKE